MTHLTSKKFFILLRKLETTSSYNKDKHDLSLNNTAPSRPVTLCNELEHSTKNPTQAMALPEFQNFIVAVNAVTRYLLARI